jgi:branched-chain amino acid transport system substrate-binding protein
MSKQLIKKKIPFSVSWFNWGATSESMSSIVKETLAKNEDCIFFVGNSTEADIFFKEVGRLNNKIKIFSHWGIVGGRSTGIANTVKKFDLYVQFIQSKFSFRNKNMNSYQARVWKNLKKNFPYIKKVIDIPRESGFIHAYDLTKLLIKSVKGKKNHKEIKAELENISSLQGLVKTYKFPFKHGTKGVNAHEALGPSDYTMAVFGEKGEIVLINEK